MHIDTFRCFPNVYLHFRSASHDTDILAPAALPSQEAIGDQISESAPATIDLASTEDLPAVIELSALRRCMKARSSSNDRKFWPLEFKSLAVGYATQKVIGGQGPGGTVGIKRTVADLFPRHEYVGREGEWQRQTESMRRSLTRWKQQRVALDQKHTGTFTLHQGRPLSSSVKDMEDQMHAWIIEQRALNRRISRTLVFRHALHLNSDFLGGQGPNFVRAATGWYYRFLKRRQLTVRRVTSSGQKLPADWEVKRDAYLEQLTQKIREQNVKV